MMQDCCRPIRTYLQTVAFLASVFFAAPALAEDVTITTGPEGLELTGRVVGYDGALLQLETTYGLMTLRYADVTCAGAACPDRDVYVPTVRLSGAAQMGEVMMPALIEAFGRSRALTTEIDAPDADHLEVRLRDAEGVLAATFFLRLTTPDEGFADLIAFEADIVMAPREVRAEEAMRAAAIGLGDITDPRQARIIGFDALIPIVSPGLDLRAISLRDVARAFRGEFKDWSELGGTPASVSLHLGPASGGPWQFFVDQVVAAGDGELVPTVIRHTSVDELTAAVASTRGSLGVVPYRRAANAQALALRDTCGFQAVPQNISLKTQDYPLTEPLFLYLPDRRQPAIIRDFFVWLRGPEAQLVVRRAGFVDQGAVPIPLDAQGQRFANAITQAGGDITLRTLQRMVRVLTPLTRLSTSFRFDDDGGPLDAVSRSNLLALGQAIRDGRYDGQRLLLVGFGDETGEDAMDRAVLVRDALISALGALPDSVTVDTEAFGAALPMGCNDTSWGRIRNRRVELWVDQG